MAAGRCQGCEAQNPQIRRAGTTAPRPASSPDFRILRKSLTPARRHLRCSRRRWRGGRTSRPVVNAGDAMILRKGRRAMEGSAAPWSFSDRPPLHLHKPNVSGEPTGLKEEYQKFWRCPGAVAGSGAPAAHLQNFSLRVLDPDRPATRCAAHEGGGVSVLRV